MTPGSKIDDSGDIRKEALQYIIKECVWKRETTVCTNPVLLRKLHGKPPFHSPALNNDNLLGKGGKRQTGNR